MRVLDHVFNSVKWCLVGPYLLRLSFTSVDCPKTNYSTSLLTLEVAEDNMIHFLATTPLMHAAAAWHPVPTEAQACGYSAACPNCDESFYTRLDPPLCVPQ